MKEYHKIQTVYKRDTKGKLIEGEFSLPEFEYLKDNKWVFTEKVDGTNIRVMWKDENIYFGGKTDNAQIPTPLIHKLTERFMGDDNYKLLKEVFPNTDVCLYGEGYGKKIQKGGGNYISDGVDFVLFDIRIGEWWLKREDIEEIAKKLNIDIVPIVGEGSLADLVELVKQGFKSRWGDFIAEGIVAKPEIELYARNGKRIVTKLKYKDFERETDTYNIALKVGKNLGQTTGQVWQKLHKIEAKHGLYDMENLVYLNPNYERKTVALTPACTKAISTWIKNHTGKIGIQELARKEGITPYVLVDFFYKKHKRLRPVTYKYKALKKLCKKYNILWEEK